MVMTHTDAKNQGQRSLSLKARVETDGWTRAIALPSCTNAVGKYGWMMEHFDKINVADEADGSQ